MKKIGVASWGVVLCSHTCDIVRRLYLVDDAKPKCRHIYRQRNGARSGDHRGARAKLHYPATIESVDRLPLGADL